MSSLDPDVVSAVEFQRLILGHWEIENCLHLQKDRYYGEDKHVCGSDWGVVWTVLTNMAVSLVRLLRREERTLREVREQCAAKPLVAKRLGLRRKTWQTTGLNVGGLNVCHFAGIMAPLVLYFADRLIYAYFWTPRRS